MQNLEREMQDLSGISIIESEPTPPKPIYNQKKHGGGRRKFRNVNIGSGNKAATGRCHTSIFTGMVCFLIVFTKSGDIDKKYCCQKTLSKEYRNTWHRDEVFPSRINRET